MFPTLASHFLDLLILGFSAKSKGSTQEAFQFFTKTLVLEHYAFVSSEVFLIGFSIFNRIPELVVPVKTFSDLSFGGRFNIGDAIPIFHFFHLDCHHFGLAKF